MAMHSLFSEYAYLFPAVPVFTSFKVVSALLKKYLYMPGFLHAEMPAITDYDMVENVNAHYLPGFHKLFCDIDVFPARLGIAGWVIVSLIKPLQNIF